MYGFLGPGLFGPGLFGPGLFDKIFGCGAAKTMANNAKNTAKIPKMLFIFYPLVGIKRPKLFWCKFKLNKRVQWCVYIYRTKSSDSKANSFSQSHLSISESSCFCWWEKELMKTKIPINYESNQHQINVFQSSCVAWSRFIQSIQW